jgi:ferredoxin
MKIIVNRSFCQSNQMCVRVAPAIFSIDDDGIAVSSLEGEPDADTRALIIEAVELCPLGALSLEPEPAA